MEALQALTLNTVSITVQRKNIEDDVSTHITHVKGPVNKNDDLSKNHLFSVIPSSSLVQISGLWISKPVCQLGNTTEEQR